MHTITSRFKRLLSAFLFAAIFSNPNPVFAESTEIEGKDAHHGHGSQDWPGIYNGFLPCADCIGLKMSLALNKNGSYVLITQYVGKSPRDFVEKGKYTWTEQNNTITLTSRDNSTTHRYSVAENMLIQLDDKGNRISGKLADRYILRRTDVTDTPQSHSSH